MATYSNIYYKFVLDEVVSITDLFNSNGWVVIWTESCLTLRIKKKKKKKNKREKNRV